MECSPTPLVKIRSHGLLVQGPHDFSDERKLFGLMAAREQGLASQNFDHDASHTPDVDLLPIVSRPQ